MPIVANFVAFQLGWFACVLGAAHGSPWVGSLAVLAIVAWHLRHAPRPRSELALVLIAAVIGAAWESALAALGWVRFPNGALIEGAAPHWMIALWMLFATTLNVSLAWLKRNLAFAAVIGAVGGPLAYLGGAKLGALVLVEQGPALAALALGWAALTPLLLFIARRYDGFAPPAARALGASHA
jgi:hypothetical protein